MGRAVLDDPRGEGRAYPREGLQILVAGGVQSDAGGGRLVGGVRVGALPRMGEAYVFSINEDAGEVEGVEVGVGQGSSSCVDGIDDAGGGGEGELRGKPPPRTRRR